MHRSSSAVYVNTTDYGAKASEHPDIHTHHPAGIGLTQHSALDSRAQTSGHSSGVIVAEGCAALVVLVVLLAAEARARRRFTSSSIVCGTETETASELTSRRRFVRSETG